MNLASRLSDVATYGGVLVSADLFTELGRPADFEESIHELAGIGRVSAWSRRADCA